MKTYTIKRASTGQVLHTGTLAQHDSYWNKNRGWLGKWTVEQDTRKAKVIVVQA